ncbi:MAG: AraC family transcriptional regulator [Proteobacteria bacterium]|nr:AraC family transcriptional regulator [Pseudomonadota bacterium]
MQTKSLSVSYDLLQILLSYGAVIGIEEKTIASDCHIDLKGYRHNDRRVPMSQFHPIWNYVLQHSNDPDFGLHFGMHAHRLLSRHLLYAMMMNCDTVEQAIRKNFLYHNLVTDLIRPALRVERNKAYLSWKLGAEGMKQERHFSESIMSLFVNMLKYLTDDNARLQNARFVHACPANTTEHEMIFNCPLFFDGKNNEVILDKNYLDSPILMANRDVLEGLEQLVQKTLHRVYQRGSWTEKVADVLTTFVLKEKRSDIQTIAGQLAMTERNLQIKLKGEGTTFRKVFDDIRKEIAIGYLNNREATICDIAQLLGFSDQSSFQHAFKRWTGKTPGEHRKYMNLS